MSHKLKPLVVAILLSLAPSSFAAVIVDVVGGTKTNNTATVDSTVVAQQDSLGDLAIGTGSSVTASGNGTAVGQNSTANGQGSAALGNGSFANVNGTSVGVNAKTYYDSVAVGANSNAAGQAVAIGSGSSALTTNSVAIGYGAGASKDGSIAIGSTDGANFTSASGIYATAVGTSARAADQYSSAFGYNAYANSFGGNGNATAVGSYSFSAAEGSTALGSHSTANGLYSVAIGYGSVADLANTVSFGSGGQERRLVNVADPINPTDAVNLRYFQAHIGGGSLPPSSGSTVDPTTVHYTPPATPGAAPTAALSSPYAPGKKVQLKNVADGSAPTDAATVGQLDAAIAGIPATGGGVSQGQLDQLSSKVGDIAQKAYGGIAMSLAMQQPMVFQKGAQVGVTIGVGSYQGVGAMAGTVSLRMGQGSLASVGLGYAPGVVGVRGGMSWSW